MLRGWFRALPIRSKLLALVLLPLLLALPLMTAFLLAWADLAFDRMLITKVRSDLAVARGYFERVLAEVAASTSALADSRALHAALQRRSDGDLVTLLRRHKARDRLDFLNLRAADGTLLLTDHGVPDAPVRAPLAARTDREQRTEATVEVLAPNELAVLAPALQWRVAVPLVETRNAAPTRRTQEDRAMVVLAAAPVRGADGRTLGYVQAGLLLNRNLPFIDHVNEIVYPDGSLPFGSRGTATVFLDDVRISTNVRLFGGDPADRAIGTRVSMAVRDEVLGRGGTWLDRAFVVNDWYVSGYLPIGNGSGERVGMLYVGYLERPFRWLKYGMLGSIVVLFGSVMIGAALLSLRLARAISAPLERIEGTMRRVGEGAFDARVGAVDSGDETGRLAAHLDRLLDVIAEQTAALRRLNAELDAKVAERTRELRSAQRQLLRSEKLAVVGQLAASVAHEMNNPIAVVQGNLDLLRELLGADGVRAVQAELKLADEQIERMRLIVTRLLQFARPAEFAGYVENVDVAAAVDDCLVLVGHRLARTSIEVRRELAATRAPAINRNELQQVLVNLVVNAIDAMPAGGTLTLASRDHGDDEVCIEVADTGGGLAPDLLGELFKPFVTRKQDGTGLGLWISAGIVERYGGDIVAANRSDGINGAVFTVLLRTDAAAEAIGG